MQCHEIKNLLDALIDSELGPRDQAVVEEHLRACAACAKLEEVSRRVKQIVRAKAEKPVARVEFKSRVGDRLREAAALPRRKIHYLSRSNLSWAAAILILATLSFFFFPLSSPPKLGHIAAAEGMRDAFLRTHGDSGRPPEQVTKESELQRAVENELGVEYRKIDVPHSRLVSWRLETVAGHKAVRMDFEPDPDVDVNKLGSGAPRISVFLLPMKSTAFESPYRDALEDGHYCQGCVAYEGEGTIFCIRKNDIFVAAVSNIESRNFARDFGVR